MKALDIPMECCLKNIVLTSWSFRSGASWSVEHACVPRHTLSTHSQLLFAAQLWLLSSTVWSSKSSAGAGATSACCMAACMELFAWTQITQAQGTPALWRGPNDWWDEWLWENGTACAVQGPLRRTWYATSWPLASQHSLPPHSLPTWHASRGLCRPLLIPVLAACSCDAALSWGSRDRGWLATFALYHAAPIWLNLHWKNY